MALYLSNLAGLAIAGYYTGVARNLYIMLRLRFILAIAIILASAQAVAVAYAPISILLISKYATHITGDINNIDYFNGLYF